MERCNIHLIPCSSFSAKWWFFSLMLFFQLYFCLLELFIHYWFCHYGVSISHTRTFVWSDQASEGGIHNVVLLVEAIVEIFIIYTTFILTVTSPGRFLIHDIMLIWSLPTCHDRIFMNSFLLIFFVGKHPISCRRLARFLPIHSQSTFSPLFLFLLDV